MENLEDLSKRIKHLESQLSYMSNTIQRILDRLTNFENQNKRNDNE